MAAFRTIVARDGFVEEMKLRLLDSTWSGPVADTEIVALELAGEKFEADALRSDWEVAADTIEAYEMFDESGVIGWKILADGFPLIFDEV